MRKVRSALILALALVPRVAMTQRANIICSISDDHAAHAIGAYGSQVNETPNPVARLRGK
jgi:hypothetical protein